MHKHAHNFKDISGQKFGRLTAIQYDHNKGKVAIWFCQCECGKTLLVDGLKLRSGHTSSCGCLRSEKSADGQRTHGKTHTLEYNSWRAMRERCTNQSNKQYADYGGRGIRVCKRWHSSFESFLSDLGVRPTPQHSLDRINSDSHYSCGQCNECKQNGWVMNCRWATRQKQANNKRNNLRVAFRGEHLTIAEIADKLNISYTAVYQRRKKNKLV